MSNLTLGQGVGIVAGAVLGYFTGGAGWYLAGSILLGASAGYAIGSALDPVAPDIPSAGQSATGELDITLADEGIVIADALGTVKVNCNIFWYGGARVKEIKEKVGGKGGKSKKVTTGYQYYLSWAMGICLGPVDELISIFSNNDPIWQGNELRSNASNGMTTISIDDFGTLYFYFGTEDHVVNTDMGSIILDETGQTFNTPYKNLCWVYFKDCNLGSYNRVPTIKFVIRKTPTIAFNENNRIGGYDYNPAHAIYYLLQNATEINASMIDTDSFDSVADALTLEGRGLSMLMGEERRVINYVESIITHINGLIQYENDGKFHLSLIRSDVDEEDMLSFSDVDFVEPPQIKRSTWDETNNDVKVQYAKRVDVPFGDPVDPIKNPDVYVMGFIDESATDGSCTSSNGGYCSCTYDQAKDNISFGDPCDSFLIDIAQYYSSPGVPKTKDWLLEGSYHITMLNRMQSHTGYYYAIVPETYSPGNYCDLFDPYGNVSLWAAQLGIWQTAFLQMISAGRGEYIPGSILRVYVDTSSFGGVAVLEPAYSQFKAWVLANYGGLVYLEEENDTEEWIRTLHEDLTPYGYGG